ncbi:MAG: DUF2306 domain-containing protein [Kordiimonadaceae bacterium]|nr:DUF2306 domain-containing protein [Kordiimonadaceae bacterium]MBO6567774.1 DUF2306 domain-containing protein [Kordiimonadaceae bacterium]MBO6963011.1 DUF2306 domain-containing protein [Kordiimonadaceae bacterium]
MPKSIWLIMTVLAIGVGGYGLAFALVPGFAESSHMGHHFEARPIAMYSHFTLGPTALIMGAFQFLPLQGAKKPAWHRFVGRLYVVCCMGAGLAGIWMAFDSVTGFASGLGFFLLGFFWLVTTSLAYLRARAKDLLSHKKWMIRSYALTYSAVTLRIQLGLAIPIMGYEFFEVYSIVAWSAWVPNALFAEWLVRRDHGRRFSTLTQ